MRWRRRTVRLRRSRRRPQRLHGWRRTDHEVTHREAPLQAVSCVERSVLGATRPLAMAGARPIAAPACERLWVSLIERADSPVVMGARERVPVPESGACSRVQMLLWTIDQLAH